MRTRLQANHAKWNPEPSGYLRRVVDHTLMADMDTVELAKGNNDTLIFRIQGTPITQHFKG